MKKKLLLYLTLLPILAFGTVQAQEVSSPEPMEQPNKLYIPLIAKGLRYDYWDAVRQGAERAAYNYNAEVELLGPQEEGQLQEQLNIIEQALQNNPQAMGLSAVDSAAVTPYLERAQAAGIPVIGFDSGVDSPIVRTTVGTDNYGAGALAAGKLAQLIGGEGKVALIVLDETSKVGNDRRDGFVDTMTVQYPDIEVLPTRYGKGDIDTATQVAKELLTAHPDLKGMFGDSESSSMGIVNAARELGRLDDIKIVGFDAGQVAQAVREGTIEGAISQDPRGIGYNVVRAAIRAYNGQQNPAFIDTGFVWYDKSNIDMPSVQAVLY